MQPADIYIQTHIYMGIHIYIHIRIVLQQSLSYAQSEWQPTGSLPE